MTYEELIESVSRIVEDEKIYKNGLILTYELNDKNHLKMNEHLFYKSNPVTTQFTPSDIFEVELGGILVKFIKKANE